MQNAKPPAATMCVIFDVFGALQYIRLLFTSVCFACSQIEIEFNLYFMYTHNNSSIESQPENIFPHFAFAVVVLLFSHHVFHSIKFIFFSSVCYPWLKLVWCVHSTYKPDLIFIFVDKFVNSGWPVKLGMMKTTRQTNENKKKTHPRERKNEEKLHTNQTVIQNKISIEQLHKHQPPCVLCFTFNSSPHSVGAMSFIFFSYRHRLNDCLHFGKIPFRFGYSSPQNAMFWICSAFGVWVRLRFMFIFLSWWLMVPSNHQPASM